MSIDMEQAKKLLLEHGSPTLQRQIKEGMLSPESTETLVREVLFQALSWARPFRKFTDEEVIQMVVRRLHSAQNLLSDKVHYETVEADTLEPTEYEIFSAIRESMPEALEVVPLWVVCTVGDFEIKRAKARVVVDFHGRKFVREYDLPRDQKQAQQVMLARNHYKAAQAQKAKERQS
jgi:hypothetical protein